jgi:hypothetical protein
MKETLSLSLAPSASRTPTHVPATHMLLHHPQLTAQLQHVQHLASSRIHILHTPHASSIYFANLVYSYDPATTSAILGPENDERDSQSRVRTAVSVKQEEHI